MQPGVAGSLTVQCRREAARPRGSELGLLRTAKGDRAHLTERNLYALTWRRCKSDGRRLSTGNQSGPESQHLGHGGDPVLGRQWSMLAIGTECQTRRQPNPASPK